MIPPSAVQLLARERRVQSIGCRLQSRRVLHRQEGIVVLAKANPSAIQLLLDHRDAEHDARIVITGPLVLFSSQTGDAWILDSADHLAAPLVYDWDPLALYIEETDNNYAIGWQGRYRIENDAFVYEDNETHSLIAIRGYPAQLLLCTISKLNRH